MEELGERAYIHSEFTALQNEVNRATELAALEKDLDISSEQAADVLALIDGEIDPSDLEEPGYHYHRSTGNEATTDPLRADVSMLVIPMPPRPATR